MRVDQLREEFDIDVSWRPFELHPEIPPEGRDRGERRPRPEGYVNPIRQLAEEAGLPFAPGRHTPNSHRSLEAAEFAREQGLFDEYHRALFGAYFGEGRDIGDLDVLKALASDVGVDPDGLGEAIETKRFTEYVNDATDEARGMGITGTPTFVFGAGERQLPIVGAQDYNVFQNIAQRMGAERKA